MSNIKKVKGESLKKDQKDLKNELEQSEIFAMTNIVKGEQLMIDDEGIKTFKEELLFSASNIDDPDKKHNIYYKGITKLMRRHLPKGKQYEAGRKLVYEEKNVFLTRGFRKNEKGIRNRDSRMGYVTDGEEALNIVANWVLKKGSMVELYESFREANKRWDN